MEIIPSIIASDFNELKTKIIRLEGLTAWAEIDVMDGAFVPNVSWQTEEDLQKLDGQIKLSAHLMVESPETVIEDWQNLVDRIVVHYEATGEMEKIIEQFGDKQNSCQLGIAVELATPVEKIYRYLDKVKIVQLMSVANIGYQGEKFDDRVLEKIKTLHENWPDVKIIADGGIDLPAGRELLTAGVSELVVGSHLWQAKNIEETIRDFQAL